MKALWWLLLCAVACASGACFEPMVLSRYDTEIGVNWRTRPFRHRGIDVPAPIGTPVLAATPGIVTSVFLKPTVGWIIITEDTRHRRLARYLHLRSASVVEGQVVERGQVIGEVGLFRFSAGVEHVHLEVYAPDDNDRPVTIDPMPLMKGCFAEHSNLGNEQFQLTYPIACHDRWYNAHRDTEGNAPGATVEAQATMGAASEFGIGSRGTLRTGVAWKRLRHYAGWDGRLAFDTDGRLSFDSTVLSGIGYGDPYLDVVLQTGLGATRQGDTLATSAEVPLRLLLRVKHRYFWGDAWLGSQWLLGDPPGSSGSRLRAYGSDEFRAGLALRLPPLTHRGIVLSSEFEEVGGERMVRVGLGLSFDNFWEF